MPPTQKQSSFAPFIVLTIIDLLFIVLFIVGTILTSDALQPWNATQGTIVGVQVIQCKGTQGAEYAVRFTDRAGQVHTATYQACGYFGVPTNLSPGDSISIIYLPDNPTVIAAPPEPSGNFQFGVCGAIFFGFCQLQYSLLPTLLGRIQYKIQCKLTSTLARLNLLQRQKKKY